MALANLDRAAPAVRVLIVSADVGESHGAMARALTRELERSNDVAAVAVRNDFAVLGPVLARILPRGFEFHLGRVKWSYDLAYRLFTRIGLARRFGESALYALGGAALATVVRQEQADVVVSTYPVMNPVLGRLRAAGRLPCPVAAVVGPLGGLGFWTHPGIDLHLLQYAEAVPEVKRLTGASAVRPIRPLVREEFLEPISRPRAREALGLGTEARLILISGGGWGAGDLAGAADACLSVPDARVIVVAGRNQPAREALERRYTHEPRASVLGFTDRMCDLLAAADAFVTATAGLSCLEARLCGCPTVCYGFAFGHVRDNRRALVEHGLLRVAETPAALTDEVTAALRAPRPQPPELGHVPSAADLTVALALGRRREGDRDAGRLRALQEGSG